MGHVPTGFSLYWFRNFSFIRWVTQRNECIEVTITTKNTIIAMSAGRIWIRAQGDHTFKHVHTLRQYGLGNQGIFNNGLMSSSDGSIYYGEYFKNDLKKDVNLYQSEDDGKSWKVRIRFPENKIRHIHSVQQDPFSGKLWLSTGDENGNYIFWSDKGFNQLHSIGFGEMFFTTHLVFTPTSVIWGSDSENKLFTELYEWNKQTERIQTIQKMPHIFFYGAGLTNGKVVFTSEREGFNLEKDLNTRIVTLSKTGKLNVRKAGTWTKIRYPLNQRAKLRMPRTSHAGNTIWMSVLKQKELPEATLIGIDANAF
jgi:hypothetical protein